MTSDMTNPVLARIIGKSTIRWIMRFSLPTPISMMRHGGGTSLYKDIYVEENPKEDRLLTVPQSASAVEPLPAGQATQP